VSSALKLGVVFPQTEIGTDPADVARFATVAEELGYHHLIAYDHVLGANTASRPGWQGPYTHASLFHEPFVLFGFLAGLTRRIELTTGVVILPQRQTALVAKQAACVDVLSNGRLRLGVGTGWNPVEYEALGANFHDRGARSEEQIELLRRLWESEAITFEGRWHAVSDAGINPLPRARRIPIWLGGMAPQVIRRAGRLADGWIPFPNPKLGEQLEALRAAAREAGRDPREIGIQCMVTLDATRERLAELEALGVTHVAVVTMSQKLEGPGAHVDAIRRWRDRAG